MIDDESLKSLEKLHQLKNDGVITEADFEKAKEKVLGATVRRPASATTTARANPLLEKFDGTLPADDDGLGWMTLPLRRYADFTGRSCRKEFWMFHVVFVLVTVIALILMAIDGPDHPFEESSGVTDITMGLWAISLVALFIPWLAVQVRRLHDQDKSGWFALFHFVPYLGFVIVYILMALDGTHGENQYGPDPLNR